MSHEFWNRDCKVIPALSLTIRKKEDEFRIHFWKISPRLVWKSKQKDCVQSIHGNSSLKYCFLQILLFWILHQTAVDKWKRNSSYIQTISITLEHKNCNVHLLNLLRIARVFWKRNTAVSQHDAKMCMLVRKPASLFILV